MKMLNKLFLLTLCAYIGSSSAKQFTSKDVKCHVCKAIVLEMVEEVSKVDPAKNIDVSGFRLDAEGNSVGKSVPMAKSETYLTEVMETICAKMEDYVKVTYKKTGKFALMKLIVDGSMNPESSNVDFVQDGDLNKSLEHFCLEVLEDHEEAFLKSFQALTLSDSLDIEICSEVAKYCDDAPLQEDYDFDEKDEL